MTKLPLLRLHTAIPISVAADPEFGLAALLRIEAQLAAWHRYGHAATVRLTAIRLRWQPTVPPAPESLLRLVTDWAVRRPPSARPPTIVRRVRLRCRGRRGRTAG